MRLTTHLGFLSLLALGVGGYCCQRRETKDPRSVLSVPSKRHDSPEEIPSRESSEPSNSGAVPHDKVVPLDAVNRARMNAHWYVPEQRGTTPLRVVVVFHGTGQPSEAMAGAFVGLAERYRFVVVAPQSGIAPHLGTTTWNVGDHPGDKSEDWPHVEATLEEVENKLGAKVKRDGWLALGFSGGASSAPYYATNDSRFSTYAVLHGGVFETGFGSNRARGWFSTGIQDSVRSPAHVAAEATRARRASGDPTIVFQTFEAGHSLIEEELEAVIRFWLDT